MRIRPFAVAVAAVVVSSLAATLQDPERKALGPGPRWRGPVTPAAHNEVFATGDGCAMCHAVADTATAMRSPTGDDVSPHGLWQATMMANSFRDPYFRAQLSKEMVAAPERADAVSALCLRCHAPMAHHSARLAGAAPLVLAAAVHDPFAHDGVSCTVCHQIQPDGLGTADTFSGKPKFGRGRMIFGPYRDPVAGPMQMHSGYTPTHADHIGQSALCASCHTLFTNHAGAEFPEQTPFLEWQNSVFSGRDEGHAAQQCQDCHMADLGTARIARNPAGRDFVIPPRENYAAHAFVGGNAFMLDLMRENRDELGVKAPAAALERMARATRAQLNTRSVKVELTAPEVKDGRLQFAVVLENLTGHKFPTGYPARRAWLHVQVQRGRELLFQSGAYDQQGRLRDVADELSLPHENLIERPDQVAVFEMVAADAAGAPTTFLTRMARKLKDNRLLPKGWRRDGPNVTETAPVGTESDLDFTGGRDQVAFSVPFAGETRGVRVVAWLHYQPVPPAWVEPLRSVDSDEAKRFVRMYDAIDKVPETVGVALKILQ